MADPITELDDYLGQREAQRQQAAVRLQQSQEEARHFIATVAFPALEQCKTTLEAHQRNVQLSADDRSVRIVVTHEGRRELDYTLQVNVSGNPPALRCVFRTTADGERIRGESGIGNRAGNGYITQTTADDISKHFLGTYKDFAR
jgi:hypothetical protein